MVDVNEQNPGVCRFYQACGFVVEGRSELDDAGRPFPLLHLRLSAQTLEETGGDGQRPTWRVRTQTG
jgi:hypothetical protein